LLGAPPLFPLGVVLPPLSNMPPLPPIWIATPFSTAPP